MPRARPQVGEEGAMRLVREQRHEPIGKEASEERGVSEATKSDKQRLRENTNRHSRLP